MPERFAYLDRHAKQYLQRHNKKLYCSGVNEVTMGFESLQKCPQGSWQKGSDTTLLLEIFEDFCDQHSELAGQHEVLRWTYTGVANINMSMRTLYRGGLWLDQHHARTASICGLNFLKAYAHLVGITVACGRDRFPLVPKLHFLHHLFLSLKESSFRRTWSLNMIATSVQMDEEPSQLLERFLTKEFNIYRAPQELLYIRVHQAEDFVGIQARTSRRCGAQHTALRVTQRYLVYAAEKLTPEFAECP